MNKENLIEYSKYYLKTLTDKGIKQALKDRDERVKNYAYLYIAINKQHALVNNPNDLLIVTQYMLMIEGEFKTNIFFDKFLKSAESYFYIKKNKAKLKVKLQEKIISQMEESNISSYRLNKDFNVNLKIAYQLNSGKPVSMSFSSLNSLYNMLLSA